MSDVNVIRFDCPRCEKSLRVASKAAGKRVRCPKCANTVDVPLPLDEDVPQEQEGEAENGPAVIEIHRLKAFVGFRLPLRVYIDGEEEGTIANGKSATFELKPGTCTLDVALGNKGMPAYEVTLRSGECAVFEFEISEGGYSREFRCVEKPSKRSVKPTASRRPQRPRVGLIIFFGITAFLAGIFGLVAIGYGMEDLGKIKRGEMKDEGRAGIVTGMVLGGTGLVLNLLLLALHFSGVIKLF